MKSVEDNFKVAVLGNGGREAAMAKALRGDGVNIIVVGDKINPQIARMSKHYYVLSDPIEIVQLLKNSGVELVLVGPEKYFLSVQGYGSKSLVNLIEEQGIPVAAPGSLSSLLELDKAFTVELLLKHGMKEYLPASRVFSGSIAINAAMKTIDAYGDVAIKPAGLTGGKKVKVSGVQFKDKAEAKQYAKELLFNRHKIIIQRKLFGKEFSLQGFVYRTGLIIFAPLVMDFKPLFDGYIMPNPNTGGMGSINYIDGSLPYVGKEKLREAKNILEKIIVLVEEETGEAYKGPICGQFMIGEDGRLYLIEINTRLGDSEAMNILPLLSSGAFLKICLDMVSDNPICDPVKFRKEAAVVKYIVPRGYCQDEKVHPVNIHFSGMQHSAEMFFSDIVCQDGKFVAEGSRAIAVRMPGKNVNKAASEINYIISKLVVNHDDFHWRKGIGMRDY